MFQACCWMIKAGVQIVRNPRNKNVVIGMSDMFPILQSCGSSYLSIHTNPQGYQGDNADSFLLQAVKPFIRSVNS